MGERRATLINVNSPFKGSCDGKDCWRCCDLCHQLCLWTSLSNFPGKFVLQGWLLFIRCRLIDFFKKVVKNEITRKICNFWPSINLPFDRVSCFKNWAWSAQPFWRVLDTKRQTNQSNSNVDVTDGKMFLGKHERHDLIIINRGVVRNLSREGA